MKTGEIFLKIIELNWDYRRLTNTDHYWVQRGIFQKDADEFFKVYNERKKMYKKLRKRLWFWKYWKVNLTYSTFLKNATIYLESDK